jgi:hypothetical protein
MEYYSMFPALDVESMDTNFISELLPPLLPRSDSSTTPEPPVQADLIEMIPAHPEQYATDVDSAYAESPEDATESLSLSMLDYRFEHGRRYHAWHDSAYWVCRNPLTSGVKIQC